MLSFLPFVYSIVLFKTVWTYGYLFYTLGYNPMLFFPSNFCSFGHCELLQFLCPFNITLFFEHFFAFWYYNIFQAHYLYFMLQPQNYPFLQGAFIPFIKLFIYPYLERNNFYQLQYNVYVKFLLSLAWQFLIKIQFSKVTQISTFFSAFFSEVIHVFVMELDSVFTVYIPC